MQPDFTRLAWASERALSVWAPRVAAINEAWLDVELTSVAADMRLAAFVFDRPQLAERVDALQLTLTYVTKQRVAITRTPAVGFDLAQAYHARDDRHIGQLLGFPECCIQFFDHVWNTRHLRDTTLAMAQHSATPNGSNILGRWLGVRLVPHLPCAFGCVASEYHARLYAALLPDDCAAWAHELLSWPVQYSALHGIAEIVWPILKVVTNTDYTRTRRDVRLMGTQYPCDAPTGLTFPFIKPAFVPLTSLATFRASVDAAATAREWQWTENGFTARDAMHSAHAQILRALDASPPHGNVLDLGCGNGLLLARIASRYHVAVEGIERDSTKHQMVPVVVRDLRDWSGDLVDTILVSQRRFDELPELEARVMASARQVLVYSYDVPQFVELRRGSDVHTTA